MIEARSKDSSSVATLGTRNLSARWIWRVAAVAARGSRLYLKASVQKQPGEDRGGTHLSIDPWLLPRQPAFVNLEMANRGPQQRCINSVGAGAAQHVAKNLITLGAQSGFEVAPHRCAEIAAPLGQHCPALFAVPRARREPRGGRDRLALRQQFDHQALALVGGQDVADRPAHQTVHAGQGADHSELLPHIEQDVVAYRCLDRRCGKGSGDRLDPAADRTGALAECDAMYAVEMANRPLRGPRRRDVGDAAQDALGAESCIEPVEMRETVEHRQYCRPLSERRPDGRDR